MTGLFNKPHKDPAAEASPEPSIADALPIEPDPPADDAPLAEEPLREVPATTPDPAPAPDPEPEPTPEPPLSAPEDAGPSTEEPCACAAEEPAVAESVVLPEIEDHEHGAASAAGTPDTGLPHGQFAAVAQPAVEAERQGMGWLIAVVLLAVALLVAAMLYWRASFRPAVTGPVDVAKQYLSALAIGDTGTQDQLATTASKGQRLPAWLGVMRSAVDPALHRDGDTATLGVRLYLTPQGDLGAANPLLREAASRPYDLELRLQRDGTAWRVDQQALFAALRAHITRAHPTLTLSGE